MRKAFIALSAASLLVLALTSTASANHAWNNYHWGRTANPFTLLVGDNVDASWDGHLATAASDWSQDTAGNPLNLSVVSGQAKSRTCRPSLGRIEVCNARYGNNGWAGSATIWLSSGGHITQGSARMNDYYMSSLPEVAKAHVMCQEVGHTFGLHHQDESGADLNTCMDYADAFDNPHPNRHDYEQLATIYAHLDNVNTIPTTAGQAGHEDAQPTKVDRRNHGHHTTVTAYFADGTKRVTLIEWAR